MLSENDLELLDQCAKGAIVLLIAPKLREFENDTQRIMIFNSEISIFTKKGHEHRASMPLEEIAGKLRNDDWEIREAFLPKED